MGRPCDGLSAPHASVLEGGCPTRSHQTCITSMFEPGAVTKYVPIGPLGPFFRVSPNQHITNRAYQYGNNN
ncbi:hypothetical protein HaLaN_25890 [Haematococcus lacustris]|uniref:Uncharacterized protein n=1 Tax=Haematococcus lacustris TaxID=44745 RepID=A0A6A0A0S9_HAELA|nr:hypothetical protein HaLaN_25890 [Haematococcus lacustris]